MPLTLTLTPTLTPTLPLTLTLTLTPTLTELLNLHEAAPYQGVTAVSFEDVHQFGTFFTSATQSWLYVPLVRVALNADGAQHHYDAEEFVPFSWWRVLILVELIRQGFFTRGLTASQIPFAQSGQSDADTQQQLMHAPSENPPGNLTRVFVKSGR